MLGQRTWRWPALNQQWSVYRYTVSFLIQLRSWRRTNIEPTLGSDPGTFQVPFHKYLHGSHQVHVHGASTKCWPNNGLMLGQHLRRWPNIKPSLCQCLVSATIFATCDQRQDCLSSTSSGSRLPILESRNPGISSNKISGCKNTPNISIFCCVYST